MSSSSTSTISSEWVNDLDAGFLEIARIPRGNGQAINERSRGDQTVLERHRVSGSAESCQQLRPADAGSGLDGETDEVHNALVKPTLEPLTSSARRHPVNAEADFANDDRINCDLNLIATQPFQDLRHRRWLGGLAEDVRIDEIGHPSLGGRMSSVVSVRSRGWNQPFSGQFNNQSTNPSLRRRAFRLSRYSPRSIRSTSNFWPGLMSSCCRMSAGRTIWPLLEMVVVMSRKILSYTARQHEAKHKKPITLNGAAAALNPHVSITHRTTQN